MGNPEKRETSWWEDEEETKKRWVDKRTNILQMNTNLMCASREWNTLHNWTITQRFDSFKSGTRRFTLRTINNNKQTNKQTNKKTKKQTMSSNNIVEWCDQTVRSVPLEKLFVFLVSHHHSQSVDRLQCNL
jgi:hypothetical protein